MPTSSDRPTPAPRRRRRRAALAVAAAFLALLALDLTRPPESQLGARALVAGIHAYQRLGRHLVPRGRCRFSPTCSSYAEVVIRERGALEGGRLAAGRLLRCGPWTPAGTKDPPPPSAPAGQ